MAKLIFMLLVLLALCRILVSVQDNIDCGYASDTIDSHGISWQGDVLLNNRKGVQKMVQYSSTDYVLDTLIQFTTGKKNCYIFNVNRGEWVLVRAKFYYGNYDGNSNAPKFDLQFDGNTWTTVETSNDCVVTSQVTYVAKHDVTSVCVAQTNNQFPFISALRVSTADQYTYRAQNSNYALVWDNYYVAENPTGPPKTGSTILTDGTHADDVNALRLFFKTIGTTALYYNGDPCLPAPYTWDWLECSNEVPPRVTALNLASQNLNGPFPNFRHMIGLKKIDLHDNNLNGVIPDYLGTMPNLEELNLADNQLSGPIPTSIKGKNIKLDVTGNSLLCTSGKSCEDAATNTTINSVTISPPTKEGSSKEKKEINIRIVLGTTIPIGALLSCIVTCLGWVCYKKKKAAAASARPAASGPAQHVPLKGSTEVSEVDSS